MELRKDPLTRSWVITGDDVPAGPRAEPFCRFCADAPSTTQIVSSLSGLDGAPFSARAFVHPHPLYRIEGEPTRRGDGLYDRMSPIGAHEVLVENPRHDGHIWNAKDAEIERFLLLAAQRMQDLKRDQRIKYISMFKNHGSGAAQEFEHPHSQLTATSFVPRRVLYELRAGRDYFAAKERCVFCDILNQEIRQNQRIVEVRGDFVALCPYAPRVPYETWIIPRAHDAAYEHAAMARNPGFTDLAALLRRTLRRIRTVTEQFHLVLHTAPNTLHSSGSLGYWKTLDEDYHWHIEIMPVIKTTPRSYTFKEVYFSPVSSETASKQLRDANPD